MPRIFLTGSRTRSGTPRPDLLYHTSSGYIGIPARLVVRDRDNSTGSYPSVLRTTGFKQQEDISKNAFDDTRTLVYVTSGANVQYPMMVRNTTLPRHLDEVVATPNKAPNIITSGTVSPSTSLFGITKDVRQQRNISPYNESRVFIDNSKQFYLTGTSHHTYPGFSSPLDDKIQIKIPLPNVSDKICSRWNSNFSSNPEEGVAGSEFANSIFTGFSYYSFEKGQWEDIGRTDPLTGGSVPSHMYFLSEERNIGTAGGTRNAPYVFPYRGNGTDTKIQLNTYQFKMSHHTGFGAASFNDLIVTGAYDKIGCPTISGQAPAHPRYHATSSQVLNVGDWIKHPFILEKAVLEIPVVVRRKNGPATTGSGNSQRDLVNGAIRDIDNYTFFMYRQSRRPNFAINVPGASIQKRRLFEKDKRLDISGSSRFLIMSASAAFYNSRVFAPQTDIRTILSSSLLPHTPAFQHDFNMPISASDTGISGNTPAPGLVNYFSGTLRLEFIPAVPNRGFIGGTRFAIRSGSIAGGFDKVAKKVNSLVLQDFWPGSAGSSFIDIPVSGSHSWRPNLSFSFPLPGYQESLDIDRRTTGPAGIHDRANSTVPEGQIISAADLRLNNLFQGALFPTGVAMPSIDVADIGSNRHLRSPTGIGSDKLSFLQFYGKCDTAVDGEPAFSGGNSIVPGIAKTNIASNIISPYLLLPGDEIVFGIDAGISATPISGSYPMPGWNDPTNNDAQSGFTRNDALNIISGSFMKLLKGDAALTLFGSLVRENHEVMPSLDQNLTSDAIHHMIQEAGPYDQYMIAGRKDLRGSYIDRFITGSISAKSGPAGTGAGSQGVAAMFSAVYQRPEVLRTKNSRRRIDPLGAIVSVQTSGSLLRGVRLSNPRERFYDTLLPDFIDYAQKSPGLNVAVSNIAPGVTGVSTNHSGSFGRGLIYGTNVGWEERWDHALKTVLSSGGAGGGAVTDGSNDFKIAFDEDDGVLKPTRRFPYEGNPDRYPDQGPVYAAVRRSPSATGEYYVFANTFRNKDLISDLLFATGWRFRWFQQDKNATFGSHLIRGHKNFSARTSISGSIRSGSSEGMAARGYRYGIMSTRPHQSSVVFRHDHFGHFRDILEQRLDTAFWSTQDTDGNLVGASKSDPAVMVQFVDETDGVTLVAPGTTDSSNLSMFATSSIPYIDGTVSNVGTGSSPTTSLLSIGAGGARTLVDPELSKAIRGDTLKKFF